MPVPAALADRSADKTGTRTTGITVTRATDKLGGGALDIQEGDLLLAHIGCAVDTLAASLTDSSGNARTGTVNGNPGVRTSPWEGFGYAWVFDGTGDYADCGATGTGASGAFTFEMRIRAGAVGGAFRAIAGRWAGTGTARNYLLGTNASGNLIGHVCSNVPGQVNVLDPGDPLEVGVEYVVALDYDGTTVRLLKDGIVVASAAVAGLQAPDAVTPLLIGGDGNGFRFTGTIDEARLSNVSRYGGAYVPASTPFTTDGNTLVLYHFDGGVALTTPSGWTEEMYSAKDGGVAVASAVYSRVATASEASSYSFAAASASTTHGMVGKLLVVRGTAATPISVVESDQDASASATVTARAVATEINNVVVFRLGAFADAGVVTATQSTGSESHDFGTDPTNAVSIAGNYLAQGAGAGAAQTWTLSSSGTDSRVIIAIAVAPDVVAVVLSPLACEVAFEATADLTIGTVEDEFPEELEEIVPPDPRVYVKRMVRTAPDPTLNDKGRPVDWVMPEPTFSDWGRLRVKVGGKWVTFWRGVPTEVLSWSFTEPFGYGPAQIRFPQITAFEEFPSWLRDGANVDIYRSHPNGSLTKLWEGLWVAEDDAVSESSGGVTLDCIGALYQLDFTLRRPRLVEHRRNVGELLAEIITPYGRDRRSMRFRPMKPVTFSGIETIASGDWSPLLTGYCGDLLAMSWLEDGSNQWTIQMDPGRKPVLRLKDRTTEHYSVHVGEPGVTHTLTRDLTQAPTSLFAEGINDDGCRWRNSKYPNTRVGDAPVFGGTPIEPDDIHADMALFSQEMYDRGWTEFDPGGTHYGLSEEPAVRAFQREAGITEDGIIGAQTWAAAFVQGSDANSILGSYIHPIYSKQYTEFYKRAPDGSIVGKYEAFDAKRLRIERYVNMGKYVNKEEGRKSARLQVEREHNPSYVGRITLSVDPPEGSRFQIKAGENIVLRGHRGSDRLLHIGRVDVDWSSQKVTLTVDEQARDVMTLAGILTRDRTTTDPNRRPRPRYFNSSRRSEDRAIVFDCENGAGIVPYHAITAGAWNVLRTPFGKYGRIVRSYFKTDTGSRMAVGVFDRPVTANQMAGVGVGDNTGDPLYFEDYWQQFPAPGDNPENLPGPAGLLIAWGSLDEPGGFHPGRESEDDPLTGVLQDDASWDYQSSKAPWLWVAIWVETGSGLHAGTNYVRGRFYQSNDTV